MKYHGISFVQIYHFFRFSIECSALALYSHVLAIDALKKFWNYDSFREPQAEIIESVMQGNDTLALLPTGAGKSICYQVPIICQDGIGIVISPLVALMKDQVENLQRKGIDAVSLHAGMSIRQVDMILDNCIFGHTKFLYLSPERLQSKLVQERLKRMKINCIAIDEAHCISQWGYDFRPAYLNVQVIRELHPRVPLMALTATATKEVVQDIQLQLGMKNSKFFKISFERKNLQYLVLHEENKHRRLLKIFQKIHGSAVIYLRNRRQTELLSNYLNEQGLSAAFYHAGLPHNRRSEVQDQWIQNKIRIIVATNAFGMGIDKADVRVVVHFDLPDSLEAYYQEAGRAGRDGNHSYPTILYNQQDVEVLRQKSEQSMLQPSMIRRVYDLLNQHFRLDFGEGQELEGHFDVVSFAQKHQIPVPQVMAAFQYLERAQILSLSEQFYNPSRINIRCQPSDLYQFQANNPNLDLVIQTLLRSYSSLFEFYVPVQESDIARRCGCSELELIQKLKLLQQYEIIDYIPSNKDASIKFLSARVKGADLQLDTQYIQFRNRTILEKAEAMLHYLSAKSCRSQLLLAYFDEHKSVPCGQCDHCLEVKNVDNQEFIIFQIKERLRLKNPTEHISLPQLLGLWSDLPEVGVREAIKVLLEEGFIQFNDKNEVIVTNN